MGHPAKNCLLMFAHDSQVFSGQSLGREVGSHSSLVQPSTDSSRNKTECVRVRWEEGLDQEKYKKKSKLPTGASKAK